MAISVQSTVALEPFVVVPANVIILMPQSTAESWMRHMVISVGVMLPTDEQVIKSLRVVTRKTVKKGIFCILQLITTPSFTGLNACVEMIKY
jgi:hypothetical protein